MRAAGHGRHAFLADTLDVLARALESQGRSPEAADARNEAAALREATGVLAPPPRS